MENFTFKDKVQPKYINQFNAHPLKAGSRGIVASRNNALAHRNKNDMRKRHERSHTRTHKHIYIRRRVTKRKWDIRMGWEPKWFLSSYAMLFHSKQTGWNVWIYKCATVTWIDFRLLCATYGVTQFQAVYILMDFPWLHSHFIHI